MAEELVDAVFNDRVDDVVALLKSGVDPSTDALLFASSRGHAGCVKV